MNKYQRLEEITQLINRKGSVTTNEIVDKLKVSDMTVRRDLMELEEQGVLTKIYGGARSAGIKRFIERSHLEKHTENVEDKKYIAHKGIALIEEGDNIFLGPGTTMEILAEMINSPNLTITTNCLPVFNILNQKNDPTIKAYLLGGEMRNITKSFVGELTNVVLNRFKFNKMFFSSNGVKDGFAMTSSIAEAYTQEIALRNSLNTYLLIDSSKIYKEDFTVFCDLREITQIITNSEDEEALQELKRYTKVLN
ncbi:DeoR/GlpR family DNA-binding transcription regulator [Staphylococcus sp. SQ8-PEA]|uniref:Lactose phosphotransferase system repressor n=1 Tax=Staphylococcus marylandisciuri TaxID=2981529 RepID=A0ABT2QMC6_9STAP|nr:DeoR/GlpR family DNA-binding transcription regulator [Staphylococcus marylandisciuri]MCU5745125.1 DeoR/GlpR family DNA-binding transcription regulator [Staphylococcus marylandisciuri]